MARVHRALDVAKWFVLEAEKRNAELSHLKLQKLLYYAQGHALATHGVPLFDAEIEAWDHGPVVAEVYWAFRDFGAENIPASVAASFSQDRIDQEARRLLETVWSEEGSKAAWVLREKTHAELPWKSTYSPKMKHVVIPRAVIEEFFKEQHMAPSLSIDEAFAEWADESYDLAEAYLPAADRSWDW